MRLGNKKLRIGLIGLCVFLAPCSIFTTNAAQVSPTPGFDIDHSGSTPTTATVVLQDGTSVASYRTDCTLQNLGTHTLFYKFEAVGVCPVGTTIGGCTGTVTTGSKQLAPGNVMNCNDGVTISSTALSILGTSGDTYALTEQFVRGQ